MLGTVGTVVCAWFEAFAASQACWLAVIVTLIAFALARFRGGPGARRPPDSFVWIPLSLAMGIAGSVLIGVHGMLGDEYYRLHELGRRLLLQGMFLGLVVGAGSLVLPLLTRGVGPPDGAATARGRLARTGHVAAALTLAGSFWWEAVDLRGGLAFRALLLAVLLVGIAGLWRRPTVPGWHRWLVWLSGWMLPAGYAVAALYPEQKKAGLHVAFIGGLALMALSVGLHVTLAHGGHERLVHGRPWQVPVYGALLAAAVVLRALIDFDPQHFFTWLAVAAAAFLAATLAWAALALPRVWRHGPR
jgi:hypothetical protein